jgi:predicted glutamine amidotransferase
MSGAFFVVPPLFVLRRVRSIAIPSVSSCEASGLTLVGGKRPRFAELDQLPTTHFRPIGTTDSEHAFCWLMDRLRERWQDAPTPRALYGCLAELCGALAERGVFNMLLSDSRCLYCFCSPNLVWLTRRAPFRSATLVDEDLTVNFCQETTPRDIVTVVATRPLTRNEGRTSAPRRTLVAFQDGELAFG